VIFASACVKDRFELCLGIFFDLSPPCLLPGACCLVPAACCLVPAACPWMPAWGPWLPATWDLVSVATNCPNGAGLVLQQGWCCSKIG